MTIQRFKICFEITRTCHQFFTKIGFDLKRKLSRGWKKNHTYTRGLTFVASDGTEG